MQTSESLAARDRRKLNPYKSLYQQVKAKRNTTGILESGSGGERKAGHLLSRVPGTAQNQWTNERVESQTFLVCAFALERKMRWQSPIGGHCVSHTIEIYASALSAQNNHFPIWTK